MMLSGAQPFPIHAAPASNSSPSVTSRFHDEYVAGTGSTSLTANPSEPLFTPNLDSHVFVHNKLSILTLSVRFGFAGSI